MKKKRKASNLWGIASVILLIGSIALLLYPFVSKVINQQEADNTVAGFDEVVERLNQETDTETLIIEENTEPTSESSSDNNDQNTDYVIYNSDYTLTLEDIQNLCLDSYKYNDAIKKRQSFDDIVFSDPALYLPDYGIYNGVYGYISIPDIDLQMPILLGASNYNMSVGVTHLYQTSLPTGGEDTNCVISGHTGFTGRTFFDNIPYLQLGSIITVTTFFGKMDYEVTEIKEIEITETNDLFIEKGKDKLTLLTCAEGGLKRWQVSCIRKK